MTDPLPYEHVNREEPIARFLLQPKWFNQRTMHVAAQAFKPRTPKPPSSTFRTSVYRTEGCSSDEIWAIGETYVTSNRTDGLRVLARADIQAEIILNQGLLVDPTPIPHPRHADIVNWSDTPEQRLEKMGALAMRAELVLPPSSTSKP
jgi:hypothetical protein